MMKKLLLIVNVILDTIQQIIIMINKNFYRGMKKLSLLILLFTSVTTSSFAQLGKMQYQDAEEQFAAGKYKETLELLEASEKSLGKSNAPIEHLRILARTELLKQDIASNIEQLGPARKEAAAFLVKYDGDTRVEDKYREVYQASKTLASLPTKAEIEARKMQEAQKKKELETLSFLPNYRDGMTVDELKAAIPDFMSEVRTDTLLTLVFNQGKYVIMVSPKTNQSFGYVIGESFTNLDRMCSTMRTHFENKKTEVTKVLGIEPLVKKPEVPQGSNSRLAALTMMMSAIQGENMSDWKKGSTSVRLMFYCGGQKKNTTGSILLTSINTAFR